MGPSKIESSNRKSAHILLHCQLRKSAIIKLTDLIKRFFILIKVLLFRILCKVATILHPKVVLLYANVDIFFNHSCYHLYLKNVTFYPKLKLFSLNFNICYQKVLTILSSKCLLFLRKSCYRYYFFSVRKLPELKTFCLSDLR